MRRRRSVQTNYGKSNQKQSEVPPQMYPYQPGFMFPIPPNNMTNMQPPGLYTHVYETNKNLNN
jgi:hypothetical protein